MDQSGVNFSSVADLQQSGLQGLCGRSMIDDRGIRRMWPEVRDGARDQIAAIGRYLALRIAAKAACILPHGVLFRGQAEATIREKLVRSGYLKGIIGLPANLFYGTGIPACILVLDKENALARKTTRQTASEPPGLI
jgi:type I restriction enzyme M protein